MIEYRVYSGVGDYNAKWRESIYPDLPELLPDQVARIINLDGTWTEYRIKREPKYKRTRLHFETEFDGSSVDSRVKELLDGGVKTVTLQYEKGKEEWTKVD